ncbi:glutathione S-transferase 2-like [Anopheles darlingi]|uniref:glutathione S-transferase 2-like n=1 Tax=Anopheles darlingi TaxID=43151 RepID=UPI0021004F32|nr:glutathione S-transferase 2-like [Anopheles darlingi]
MLDLYYLPGSSPCRAVQMVAAALNVPLNLKFLNLMAGEHRKPEYVQLNPQRSIPTLVDCDRTRLFFDACVLYPRFTDLYHPVVFGGATPEPKKVAAFEGALAVLDTFLGQSAFVAGARMTIADISLFATLATACALRFQLNPFANVHRWYGAMLEHCPGAALNVAGAKDFCSYK